MHYDLYELNDNIEHLQQASDFSINHDDETYANFNFFDAVLIKGSTTSPNYKIDYFKYLKKENKLKEAFQLMSEIAFTYPNEKNLSLLKNLHDTLSTETNFEDFWLNYFNTLAEDIPAKEKVFNTLATGLSEEDENKWILLDFWGTWCSPCLDELPTLQKFHEENEISKNSKLKIHTLSYASRKLDKFMEKNSYTFSVHEINNGVVELFKVKKYPTKLLISPQGKYIELSSENWSSKAKNYMLFNNE